MKRLILYTILIVITFYGSSVEAQKHSIKFATLAPEGSTWMNVMRAFDKELREETGGEVGFKIYGGGVLGDEKDIIRKIRIGQVHAAGFTGFGMGEILPEIRILDTPFLFRNKEEVDFIYDKFYERFARGFEENSFVLLGWAEVGFIYVFTKTKASNLDEIRQIKMWVWEGDRVAEATFEAFGLQAVPLSVIDVMTALQTNMVEGVYTSPLAAVALQWFTKVNYMINAPLANAAGAVLISTRQFNKLPQNHQSTLMRLGKKYLDQLNELSRKDNVEALKTLKKNNVEVVSASDQEVLQDYYRVGKEARRALVDKFYSMELLKEVESALSDFRMNSQTDE